ncbi:sensor histidine kinase [Xanthobacter autotrophicus]|uniref:sensor histidine kinase n=1 Tax=Xanthobacter autotrophicus TaxID=280 RepID=UPI0024A6C96D|nr:HAMP domain-containing sensor histidine kinase [Xanthobacter autotrophicus]MDI4655169.1 HAMP domain-containing histidine kinase [Xanthobacter autotrophicus]
MSGPRQSRRWSLGRRLGLWLAASVAALWLAAATVAGLVLRHEIGEVFDSALQEVAQRVLPLAYSELLSREAGDAPQHMAPIGVHREYITYVVRDGAGRVLLQSSDAELMAIPPGLAPGFHTTDRLRTYTEAAVRGTIVVTTAEELGHRAAAVRRAVMALIWPLVALVPIALAGVWLSVRLSLKPVLAFRRAIAARGRGNLTPVSADGLPEEMAPVAASVNALMERLRGALEAERGFTANSAHELRTPIAAALAQTQRLLAELPEGATRQRARDVAGALRRLTRLSEKLLQLAKAEGGGLLAEHPAPLGPVLRHVIAELDHQTERGSDLVVAIPPDGGPVSDLDPDAFAVLARNLIENALKHGAPETPIHVRLSADGFEVANRGPVVPADRLAALLRPFERGPTQAEGSGLGLAIAAAVCRGAGLRLDLASPIPGEADGFQVTVRFPTAILTGS